MALTLSLRLFKLIRPNRKPRKTRWLRELKPIRNWVWNATSFAKRPCNFQQKKSETRMFLTAWLQLTGLSWAATEVDEYKRRLLLRVDAATCFGCQVIHTNLHFVQSAFLEYEPYISLLHYSCWMLILCNYRLNHWETQNLLHVFVIGRAACWIVICIIW